MTDLELIKAAGGCPQRHAETVAETSASPQWTEWFLTARSQLGRGGITVLTGDRGSGKTQIATELVRYARQKWAKAKYTTAMDLFLRVRGAYQPNAEVKEADIIAQYVEPRLLVIDEIQERGGTEFEDRVLVKLIDDRYGRKLDTVIIGNLKPDRLWEQLGRSIKSRFDEGGVLIECVGVNWRKGVS